MKQWQGTVEANDSNPASNLSNQLEQWDNVTAENVKLQHLRTSGMFQNTSQILTQCDVRSV